MPEAMITQFGFFPKTTIKSAFIQGSSPFIEQSATFLNGKNNNDDIPCLKEVVLGVEALAEAERKKRVTEKRLNDAAVPLLTRIIPPRRLRCIYLHGIQASNSMRARREIAL